MDDPNTPTNPAPTTPTSVDAEASRNVSAALQTQKEKQDAADESAGRLAISQMNLTDRVENSRKAFSSLSQTMSNMATNVFGKITGEVTGFMDHLSRTNDLATQDMTKFGLATTAVLGPLKSFSNVSFPHINTFTGQFNDLFALIGNNDTAIGKLANQFGLKIPSGLKEGSAAFRDFVRSSVEATLQSADSAVKLEDVWTKAAASTGRLGALYSEQVGGTGLKSINRFIEDQRSAISNASKAVNLPTEVVEAYYQQLMNLPTAYKAGTSEQVRARGNTDQLANSIQLAKGLGRDYTDVLDDMRVAIRNYNASMPEAMKFTQQISEISGKYNIELKDVQSTLRGTAEAFKYFGNEGEGAAEAMNEYVSALEKVGVSGAVSSDIVGNMFNQISKMSVGAKSFLSTQQGGPGGLMGSFDIDMKLRNKQFKEVSDMVKNQLTQMMGGSLVSTQQAANSPAAAAQMQKEIAIVKSGPLGQFARSDAEAEDIIDAFKGGKAVDFKKMSEGQSGVQTAIETGNIFAKQTATAMSEFVAIAKEMMGAASGANLNMVQGGLTAEAGFTYAGEESVNVQKSMAALGKSMAAGAAGVSKPANVANIFREDFPNFAKDISTHILAAVDSIGSLTGAKKEEKYEAVKEQFTANANRAREDASKIKDEAARKAAMERIDMNESASKTALDRRVGAVQGKRGTTFVPEFLIPKPEAATTPAGGLRPAIGNVSTPGATLGTAASTNAARGVAANVGQVGLAPAQGAAAGQPGGVLGQLAVTVNIHCAKCGATIDTSSQLASVSTAAGPLKSQPSGDGHGHMKDANV